MSEGRAKSLWVGATVIGVIIVIGLWCWLFPRYCWFCRFCPDECPEAVAHIKVDDTTVSTWMAFDNGWTNPLGPASDTDDEAVCQADDAGLEEKYGPCLDSYVEFNTLVPGVLFQLGTLYEPDPDYPEQPILRDNLGWVDLTLEGGQHRILKEKADMPGTAGDQFFDWLDIYPMGSACVIDAKHAYRLFENDQVTVDCESNDFWGFECMRNRALHASFRANRGVITYWSELKNPYSVEVERKPGVHTVIAFDFQLPRKLRVDVWLEGCWQQRYENVSGVRIVYDEGSNHGGYHDPPMDGEELGP